VLFSDLVGSTPLAGLLDPEDFRELLALYHQLAVQAIERYGGYAAQLLGDGVVACFGYPRAHEDDAQRAVYAGLAILEGLDGLNARLRTRFDATLQVRIGCHTGVVVAGAMEAGSGRDEFAMVGETPHIAARLQGVADPGSVVVSDVTQDLIRGYFETETLGEQTLAGVARPIRVHQVLRPTGAEARLDPVGFAHLTPFVGRTMEMEMLAGAWRGVREGRGALVQLSGEPGIGKSRLVHALAERLGDDLAVVQRWQCSRHYQTTMLYPVIRLLESRFNLKRGEREAEQLESLRAATLGVGLDPDETLPLLVDLLALRVGPAGRQRSADAQEERTSLLRILQSLLVSDPGQHPMLLAIEDVQWADPTTMELLWRVVNELPRFPVLCVVTHRQDFSWPWRRQPGIQIELGPLPGEQVRELVSAATDAGLEEDVLEQVCAAAEGIPLFVEEMLKMLALDRPPAATGFAPAERAVPATLHGLLAERLDALSESDLGEVLDVAAVLGREFDRELLEAVEPLAPTLGPALGKLAVHEILRPLGGQPVRWEFSHALLHDAAYSRVLRRRRQELHARVAHALVADFPARAEREPELVAHHFSCAVAPGEAARYWHAAGIRALERAAFVEAAEHFRRGLEALAEAPSEADTEERRADFLTHLGAALQAGHGYAAPGVDEAYAPARARWQAIGDDERLSAVIRGQWMSHLVAADYGSAYELAEEMLGLSSRSAAAFAEGHLYAGLVHMYRGELAAAEDHLGQAVLVSKPPERVVQVYEAQGDTVAGAHGYLASVLSEMGQEHESLAHSDRSLELAEYVDRPVTRAQAWFMRAGLHLGRGELGEFGAWVAKVHAYSVDRNIRYWRTIASAYSNWGRAAAGDRDGGIERLQASIDSYVNSGARLGLVHLYLLLADLLAEDSQSAALETIALAEEQLARSGERLTEVDLHRFKARVLVSGPRPDAATAIAELERAVGVAKDQGARLPELRALGQLVRHRRRAGADAAADEQALVELCGRFATDSQLPDVMRARGILGPVAGGA
jgi:class 3 adenylate cyclase/tetratricopeptide (TPR) repeat protein